MLARFTFSREDVRVEGIGDEPPVPLGLHDAALPQNLEMMRDVGDLFLELFRKLTDMLLPAAQRLHDPQAVFVRQRSEPLRAELGGQAGGLRKLLHPLSITAFAGTGSR